MTAMTGNLVPMMALAFLLGMKHGMDADHLATIDGLTRFNAAAGRVRLARWCGFLFSLGHGLIVSAVAVGASVLLLNGRMPDWLDSLGLWVSAFFLIALGILNLYAVFSTPAGEMVQMVGLRGRWLGRLNEASNPAWIALVGALFAISFDTLSQAALFSAASLQAGGVWLALLLALGFMVGMMLTDALNGLWISHLLQRADAMARAMSRIMGITVATLSFGVAGLGLSRHFFPEVSAWQDGRELMIGCALILIVGASFLLARYSVQRSSLSV